MQFDTFQLTGIRALGKVPYSYQSQSIFQGYCESGGAAEPLQPFLQIVRKIFADNQAKETFDVTKKNVNTIEKFDSISPDGKRNLYRAINGDASDLTPLPSSDELTVALVELFSVLQADEALILAIEDWQWADIASQQVLDAIRLIPRAILILVSQRNTVDDNQYSQADHVIQLDPLDAHILRPIIQNILPGADPLLIGKICEYAGGVPLYVEELCHATNAGEKTIPLEKRIGIGTAWLNSLIDARIDRLPTSLAEIVKAAAVLGNVFPKWLLERISEGSTSEQTLALLRKNDLIFPGEQDGTLRFKHGITRDVVYASVGLYQKRSVHISVADALEAQFGATAHEEHCEALAYHYGAGGLHAVSARFAEIAGDKAMRISALDLARTQYLASIQALENSRPMSEFAQTQWISISQKLGMACVFDPLALSDGVAIFTRAVELAELSNSIKAVSRTRYWLGYIYYAKGLAALARRQCEQALELAIATDDLKFASQVKATIGQILLSACEYAPALELLNNALNTKRQQNRNASGMAIGPAYTLACKGYLLGDRGDFSLAHECFDEALHLLGDSRHQIASSVRHWLAVVLQWQGRWKESAAVAEESAKIAMYVRSRQQLAVGKSIAGYSRWMLTGNLSEFQTIRDATSWIVARKGGLATSLNHGWMVDCALANNLIGEARVHAALLLKRARHSDRIGEAMGCRALARLSAKQGTPAKAKHYLTIAESSAVARESAHESASNMLCQAEISYTFGDSNNASRLLDAANEIFVARQMQWHLTFSDNLRRTQGQTALSALQTSQQ
jgi:tetratricopeptide (TPR) repeat protein